MVRRPKTFSDAYMSDPTGKPDMQPLLLQTLRQVCLDFGLPRTRAGGALRALLGSDYVSPARLPQQAPVVWKTRTGENKKLNPLEFLDRHWGAFIEAGVMFQADLQWLDRSLYLAVDSYCRYRGLDPKDYLPPPLPRSKQGPHGRALRQALKPVVLPASRNRDGLGRSV